MKFYHIFYIFRPIWMKFGYGNDRKKNLLVANYVKIDIVKFGLYLRA